MVACLVVALLIYLAGITLLFPILVLLAFMLFLPTPGVLNSWFGRFILALFFTYSAVQVAAALQFLIDPHGKFKLIAILLLLLTALGVIFFGKASVESKVRFINGRDVCALIGCLFFVLPFLPVVAGSHSTQRIARIGTTQIVDAVTHYTLIGNLNSSQNFNYDPNVYYPAGYHIATAFLERSILGDLGALSWNAHVYIFFYQYLLSGIILCYLLITFGYQVMDWLLGKKSRPYTVLSLALAIGTAVTLTALWLFVSEGFLNYFYVCAALLTGLCYILDPELRGSGFVLFKSKRYRDKWPLVAYLILTLGIAYTWPLLTPPVLIVALLFVLPRDIDSLKEFPAASIRPENIAPYLVVVLTLPAVYFQLHYNMKGHNSLAANGALQSFDLPLLIVLIAIVAVVIGWQKCKTELRNHIVSIVMPFALLSTVLTALQYLQYGQVRYYPIKSTMPLEMILIVIGVTTFAYVLSVSKLSWFAQFISLPTITMFIVVANIGMLQQPFGEVRSLFRGYLGNTELLAKDTTQVSRLGAQGKITPYDVTILHYSSSDNVLYAQIETAMWSATMAHPYNDLPLDNCSGWQYILLNKPVSALQQSQLKGVVSSCVQLSVERHRKYYIVTDQNSVRALRTIFGNQATYVY